MRCGHFVVLLTHDDAQKWQHVNVAHVNSIPMKHSAYLFCENVFMSSRSIRFLLLCFFFPYAQCY